MSSVSVTFAIAVAAAVAVDVGAVAVGCPYFFIGSVANREATEIQATWVVQREKMYTKDTPEIG